MERSVIDMLYVGCVAVVVVAACTPEAEMVGVRKVGRLHGVQASRLLVDRRTS